MASAEAHIRPSITPNDHGPRVTIVGAIMLAATILMIVVCFFNRYNAQTIHHPDSLLIFLGAAIDVACFSVYAIAVNRGFGHHASKFTNEELRKIEQDQFKLFLVSLLLFFLSHGVIKIAYNILARKTSRSHRLTQTIDGFTAMIGLWTLSNIIVVAVALGRTQSPTRPFFWASGVISMLIILGQLFVFLWIIWRTRASRTTKIQWSISMGAFVPLCIAVIIVRLVYTPSNYFDGDWTFNDVFQAMLFLIELNLVTITVLAPNLPVFFKKTSTGGVYFLPGEAVGGTKSDTRESGNKGSKNSYALSSAPWSNSKSESDVYTNEGDRNFTSTATQRSEGRNTKQASFDSDRILIRTSIEIERSSERGESTSHQSTGDV